MWFLEVVTKNSYELGGDICFQSVTDIFLKIRNILEQKAFLEISLEKIKFVDSAGLSMLVTIIAEAKKRSVKIVYTQIPDTLYNIAKIHRVEEIFKNDVT